MADADSGSPASANSSAADRTTDEATDRGAAEPRDSVPAGELDYGSLPDPLEGHTTRDAELDYASLPDPLEGHTTRDAELDYASLPDPLDSRGGDASSDARTGAVPDLAEAGAKVREAIEESEPMKEVEFREPEGSRELTGPDTVLDPAEAARERAVIADAKAQLAGREAAGDSFGGDPIERADQWHWQGLANDQGMNGTCGLASAADVLRVCGQDVSENDLVHEAAATGRCVTDSDPMGNGATNAYDRASLLADHGVDNQIVYPQTPDNLAAYVEHGHGVITAVNADRLWGELDASPLERLERYSEDEQGEVSPDHAVVVTGTVRDDTGSLTGFVINDHGDPLGAARIVDLDRWNDCWTEVRGDRPTNVTNNPTSVERNSVA